MNNNSVRSVFSDSIRVAFCILVLPNVLLYAIAFYCGIVRPLVNFDYALVLFLAFFVPRYISVVLMGVAFVLDVLVLVGQVFPFLRFEDALYLLRFIDVAPLSYILGLLILLAVMMLNCLIAFGVKQLSTSRGAALLSLNVIILAYLGNYLFFQNFSGEKYWRPRSDNLIDSQLRFTMDTRMTDFVHKFHEGGEVLTASPYQGVSEAWFESLPKPGKKLVLIVSESWGVTEPQITRDILAPILEKRMDGLDIEWGEIPFSGATVAGELRELCRLAPNHFNLVDAERGFESCLPNLLRQQGYSTLAMHGASGLMYDRIYWYPRAGFDNAIFFESKRWARRCYSFPGACDDELIGEVGNFLKEKDKAFVYWLTLNSHAIYDARDIRIRGFDCAVHGISENSQTCRNLSLHYQFFANLAEILDEDYMHDVRVIVVGDHEPPILNKDEKKRYFKDNAVSWLTISVPTQPTH